MSERRVEVFSTPDEVAEAARKFWVERQQAAAADFWVSLAGGTTPKVLYRQLADEQLDWKKLHLIWGDERFVPHDHADSNYRMVRETLLDRVQVGLARPWTILEDAQASAEDYEDWLQANGPARGVDLALLGMGDDGHTASLFPDTAALAEQQRNAVANWVPKFDAHRLTLTYPYLNRAKEVLFLITGANKALPLREVLEQGKHPSAGIQAQEVTWFFVDAAAAAELE